MKTVLLILTFLSLSSCKRSYTAPQIMPEFPEVNLTPKPSGAAKVPDSVNSENEIIYTTIGSSNTLVPRIQGKWTTKCAPPSWLYPFPHDRELSFSETNFIESLTFYPIGSDCLKAEDLSGKITHAGKILVVDGTIANTKVNLSTESTTYLFTKENSIFAHFKSLESDLKLAQEKKSQNSVNLFTLMRVDGSKLCFGLRSSEKNGLSEVNRPETLDESSCLIQTK